MILVTGGTGFIGSNLVGALAERGARVSICDTLGTGDKWRNIARHEIDEIVDPSALEEFLTRRRADIDFIYHMGAISATTETDVDLIADSNLRLSQTLWRWCSERRVPFIYASSAATYGDGAHGFADEDSVEALASLRPLNAYGWSKHAFDRWVARQIAAEKGVPPHWAGLKFFNVYGPNEHHKGDMMSVVTKSYPGAVAGDNVTLFRSHHPDYENGGQMRDFVYVRDCVDLMLWMRDSPPATGLYNVGSGRAQTWLALMSALYNAVDQPLEIKWVDTPIEIRDRYQYFTQADMSKLRAAGYDKAFMSVEEGVADYVERYLSAENRYA
ncbi:MAG: ADP-glyceromanno-heptose 6-epimerase [Longimicrobiales bacterium]|nr:ADP-glyceromanno-heptose 6-epimerase [Longimicrobiales bacterium]